MAVFYNKVKLKLVQFYIFFSVVLGKIVMGGIAKFIWAVCTTVPNSVAIGQIVAEIWRFVFLKMAADRHLGFAVHVFGSQV